MTASDSSTSPRNSASAAWACLWLSLALAGVFPLFAAYGFSQAGPVGLSAAALAGLVCWQGAVAALVVSSLFRSPEKALIGLLLGMFFRMGLPLAVGLLLSTRGGPLVEAGVLGLLVGYYLVALLVETLLSLRFVSPAAKVSKAA